MHILDPEQLFSEVELDVYDCPMLPKEVDNRGYLYVVTDTAFPAYFKIGKTQNMKKRLAQYNQDKPYPTTRLHAISEMFEDVGLAERNVLQAVYRFISPVAATKEWFTIEHIEEITQLATDAEGFFIHKR